MKQVVRCCDVCGSPATNYARDVYKRLEADGTFTQWPADQLKSGCDVHIAQTVVHQFSQVIWH